MNNLRSEWFAALQRILPQHTLSRIGSFLAEAKNPWLKNLLINLFIRVYDINLDEAKSASPNEYQNFNDFFTRALKEDARPVNSNDAVIVCPADGIVSQMGAIREGNIFQAKGKYFSSSSLLGADDEDSRRFLNGDFITIYLSPKDYHRVHMPIDGELLYTRYIPGKLFSVNLTTTKHIDGLFAKNERLVCIFKTPAGLCAVVLVGAMMVAGIESVWHGHYHPNTLVINQFDSQNVRLKKGEEMGRFKFGSTVIVMFEPNKTAWSEKYMPGSTTHFGEIMTTHVQHQ
ncbi:MAG: archaetidylserine decarboxylase [Pseudomonadales bacterium]|jgi:phosphatidylserine decarboxylase|tara:strand:+ start:5927 stop:6787 length:861 start_codon:yes stop_codon:yes gene_type:complete